MDLNLYHLLGFVVSVAFGVAVDRIRSKKTDDLRRDERTQKVGGKAAQMTIVVIMVVMAIIMWGKNIEVFEVETPMALSLVFFSLMISMIAMIGFLRYYNKKEI